jgi:hypothetical protein
MMTQNDEQSREHRPDSTLPVAPGRQGPWSFCAKISSATMIIVGFFQAVYGDGLGAIEFWLSLCFAAASQQPADDKPGESDRTRDEIRHRQIM